MSLSFLQRLQIGAKERQEWYEVLASMTDSDTRMAVSTALTKQAIEFKKAKHPMAPMLRLVISRMTGGTNGKDQDSTRLGDSLKGLVPANEATMIKAGEQRGDVSRGLHQAAFYVRSADGLIEQVRLAMSISMTYFVIVIAMHIFFSMDLLPQMEATSKRINWPLIAQRYGWVADHMVLIAGVFTAIGLGCWFLVKWLSINWTGKGRDFADKHIWPFTTIRLMNSSALLMGLSGFIKAGSPFDVSISLMSEAADPYMRKKYELIRRSGKSGKQDFDALLSCGLIPKERTWIIRCYGETADFGLSLEKISREFIVYATNKTAGMAKRLNLICMALVAANIGWVAAAVAGIVRSVK